MSSSSHWFCKMEEVRRIYLLRVLGLTANDL